MFLVLTGCTGIETKVTPDAPSTQRIYNNPIKAIGVRQHDSKNIAVAGDMSADFVHSLTSNRMADDVFYPSRSTDKTDLNIEVTFESTYDDHAGALAGKSFLIGFLVFLPEPFIWYDFDYSFSGKIDIIKDKRVIDTIDAKTDANISVKWLSLGELEKTQKEVIDRAKKSLFSQLQDKLYSYRHRD